MWSLLANPLLRQYVVVVIVNLSVVIVGMGAVWPSPVLVKLRNINETILPHPISDDSGAWIVSIGCLIATITNFFAAYLVHQIGRKYCTILSLAPRILIGLIYIFANSVWMLLIGRAISGILDNLAFIVVPMYASEVASKEVRGSLGTLTQIFSSIGILLMLSIGPYTRYVPLNIISTCFAAVFTIPVLSLPDSPYFLYSKGRINEARKILVHLRGSTEMASNELQEYASSASEVEVSTCDLLKNRIFMKTLGINIVLAIGLQLIGFSAVIYYLQTVLESTQTSIQPEISSVIIGCIQLIASICTAFIIDRFGRKRILSIALAGQALGMFGLGMFFKLKGDAEFVTGIMNFIPLVSLIMVVVGFIAGPGAIFFLLGAELFEGPFRAAGVGCSLFFTSLSLFITARYFPMFTNNVGPAVTYWILGLNCIILMLFILFCVPETKGKTFAEIQVCLGAKVDSSMGLGKLKEGCISTVDE